MYKFLMVACTDKKAMEMYTKSLKQRVVGGRESIKGEAPYFAVFGIAENPKWPWCGGAIYNKDTVLVSYSVIL